MTGLKRSKSYEYTGGIATDHIHAVHPRLRLTVGNVIETQGTRAIQRAVKRISVVKTNQIPVKTSDTNLTEAIRLAEQAPTNRLQVMEGALTVENQLNAVILHYFLAHHTKDKPFSSLLS